MANPRFTERMFEAFPEDRYPGMAEMVLCIIRNEIDLEVYPPTADLIRQCWNRPKGIELKLCAINHVIDGHGVEAIFDSGAKWPDMEYVNLGDTYTATVVFDWVEHKWMVTSWGHWIEHAERQGRTYA